MFVYTLIIHTDLIEFKIAGDTKARYLHAFFSFQSEKVEKLQLIDNTWKYELANIL